MAYLSEFSDLCDLESPSDKSSGSDASSSSTSPTMGIQHATSLPLSISNLRTRDPSMCILTSALQWDYRTMKGTTFELGKISSARRAGRSPSRRPQKASTCRSSRTSPSSTARPARRTRSSHASRSWPRPSDAGTCCSRTSSTNSEPNS